MIFTEDITERKLAEEALQESEERFRLAQEAAHIGTFDWNVRTGLNRWTPELEAMYGLPPGSFAGTQPAWEQLVHPADRARAVRDVERAFETGEATESDFRVTWPDGSVHWLTSRWQVIYDASGDPQRMLGINIDITERKQAEEALRESEARLRTVLETLPVGVLILDAEHRIIETNGQVEEIFGGVVPIKEPLQEYRRGKSWWTASGQPVGDDEWPSMQAMRQGTVILDKEIDILRADGTRATVLNAAAPLRNPQGEIIGAVVIIRDITERKLAEEQLSELVELLDLSHVMVRDPESKIIYWGTGDEALYGYTRKEAIGRVSHELLKTDFPVSRKAVDAALKQTGHWEGELVHTARDGRKVVVASHQVLHRDAEGHPGAILEVNNDITELKQAEKEIRQLNAGLEQRVALRTAQLEAANKEMEAFNYSVSHDLRAPLRIIDGFSRALVKDYQDKLGDDGKADINWIREAVQKMGQLIDDFLSLSRIGRTEPHFVHLDLSALAQSIIDELRKADSDRQVSVAIQPDLIPCADAGLIKIVLENLLSNAWKFTGKTPGACIEFGARDSEGEQVYFVQDNGAGFNMAYVDRLFTPFERLHSESEFPGTGIGLAIVRRIITMHGGRAWAEGEVGKGATFFFTLHPEGTCI